MVRIMTPREQLANMLQRSRTEAGYESPGALAEYLHVARPVVSKAEDPSQPVPADPILAAWAGATGAPLDELADLARRARSRVPDWFASWRAAEAAALLLRYWSPTVVPGIAQTPGYMRALFSDEGHLLDQADDLVTARLERQSVIVRAPVTMIIAFNVLYRGVGSPAVMAEQCAHLAGIAERVSFHILPDGMNMGVYGAFDIAAGGTTTVRMSGIEDITSTDRGMVSKATVAFERLLGAALPRQQSLTHVRTAEGQWKART
jgi:hypothetical protein